MRFSIITPVYLTSDRIELFKKCAESVEKQTFGDFEWIVVNDGSPQSLNLPGYPFLRVINQPNLQRMTAYNTGFKYAQGEIFCLLDSDDEYESNYLEEVNRMYQSNTDYEMFNFGCTRLYADGGKAVVPAFKPKELEVGHEVFGGGNIINGTFVFTRNIYQRLRAFPEGIKTINVPWYKSTELFWTSPYDFSAYAQAEFPEIQPFFQVKHPDHPAGLPKELGNPYGNDYYLFYKYTRKFKSKPFDMPLLKVHLRV